MSHNSSAKTVQWASELNQHFVSVGPGLAASLETAACVRSAADTAPSAGGQRRVPGPPGDADTAVVSSALHGMRNSKSSGADGITVAILKQTFPVVGPHLLRVVNRNIRTGKLPDELKAATVTPLFKSGDVKDVNCFRPVSVLSTVSKLAERVVYHQLVDYLSSHGSICSEQHGLRRGHSTESAMLDAVQFVISETDRGRVVTNIAAAMSKAFDSVEHGRLLEKLGWYTVSAHWFSD